jgi:hypothetical protein
LKEPLKIEFKRRTLPYTTVRSVGAPLYTLRECYNALSALFEECCYCWECQHPLFIVREHYSTLMPLLGERYLFWEKMGLLRRIRKISLQSLKVVGFESLVKP